MTINKRYSPYALIAPALAFFLIFSLIPLAGVFYTSTFRTNFIRREFVGLRHYIALFTDKDFLGCLVNSFLYTIMGLPIGLFLSVSFAMLIYNTSERWQNYARIMVYLPGFVGAIILTATWRWVWSAAGPVNSILGLDIVWFSSRWKSIIPIIISSTISGWGGSLLYFSAGLSAISKETIEAAKCDGATWRQIRWKILMPQIRPLIVLVSIIGMAGWMQEYFWVQLMAPYPYAGTLMWQMYTTAFRYSKYGKGSSYSVVLMFIILTIAIVQKKLTTRKNDG